MVSRFNVFRVSKSRMGSDEFFFIIEFFTEKITKIYLFLLHEFFRLSWNQMIWPRLIAAMSIFLDFKER